jgi:hypothetical protein
MKNYPLRPLSAEVVTCMMFFPMVALDLDYIPETRTVHKESFFLMVREGLRSLPV